MNRLLLGLAMIALVPWAAVAAPPVTMTAEQDHQQMMDQLHIISLRPGPSGDENAPDHANTDESKANPYPDWPDVLTLDNGQPVTTARQWWDQRRPQIVETFEREVYGRIPADVPGVTWRTGASEMEFIAFRRMTATQLIGHVDNSGYPEISVDMKAMLILPADVKGPVPVLIMFAPAKFPAPMQPQGDDLAKINAALKADLVARDPSLAGVFANYPAYDIATAAPWPPLPGTGPDERVQQLISDGWGVVLLDTASIQADNGAGLTRGIIGLTNHGQPRKPDDWGALRAWGWGASRVLDYLQTRPEVDAKHVGVEGVSRWGKAALVATAFDPRFSMVLAGSSGEGGAKPHRRNFGEAVESLTGTGEYHWMAGNFLKYGGPLTPNDLPVESHELIALCAPRLVFISYGVPSAGDAKWLDQQGSYMATVAAGKVWRLLGAKDLGIGDDYRHAAMPPVLSGLTDGQLAWRQHDGGHTDAPNMASFIRWADANMGRPSLLK